MSVRRVGLRFLAVGSGAALTHVLVFTLTRERVWPELANAFGFAVAFCVSFAGHRWLSFQDTRTGLLPSLRRFALTAAAGFVANELCFMLLLHALGWPDLPALLLALVLAAGQTFVLSRFWAFAR